MRAPGLRNARGLLHRDPLPALGARAREAGCGVLVGLGLGAKGDRVVLAQPKIVSGQGIERLNLGVVGVAEANMREGTSQAHQFTSSAARNWGFFRLARLRP